MASMNDAEAAARAIIGILASGDLDAVSSAVAEEYIDHQGLGDVEIRGPHGFRRVVAAVQESPDMRVTIEDIVAAEDKAALRLRWHGTTRAGRTVTRETLDLLRFADGRLIEHWGAELFRRERLAAAPVGARLRLAANPVDVSGLGRRRVRPPF
jgi:predicted ester cyclase